MISQMSNQWDKIAFIILATGKMYIIGAVAMMYLAPSMTPFFLLIWAIHWTAAVCIAIKRQIQIHYQIKELIPSLYLPVAQLD